MTCRFVWEMQWLLRTGSCVVGDSRTRYERAKPKQIRVVPRDGQSMEKRTLRALTPLYHPFPEEPGCRRRNNQRHRNVRAIAVPVLFSSASDEEVSDDLRPFVGEIIESSHIEAEVIYLFDCFEGWARETQCPERGGLSLRTARGICYNDSESASCPSGYHARLHFYTCLRLPTVPSSHPLPLYDSPNSR